LAGVAEMKHFNKWFVQQFGIVPSTEYLQKARNRERQLKQDHAAALLHLYRMEMLIAQYMAALYTSQALLGKVKRKTNNKKRSRL
jgi:hypothetical protein